MKKIYILVFTIITLVNKMEAHPPLTNILSNAIKQTYSLSFYGDDLYIADSFAKAILKIDTSVLPATPSVTTVITLTDSPYSIAFKGNELYMPIHSTNGGSDKISKIDVTATSPTVTDVIAPITSVLAVLEDIVFYGNKLYISQRTGTISKMDITDPTLTVTDVFTTSYGISEPTGLPINGNQLFIADNFAGILKSDISATSPVLVPVTHSPSRFDAVTFKGNDLYACAVTGTKTSSIFNLVRPVPPVALTPTNPVSARCMDFCKHSGIIFYKSRL